MSALAGPVGLGWRQVLGWRATMAPSAAGGLDAAVRQAPVQSQASSQLAGSECAARMQVDVDTSNATLLKPNEQLCTLQHQARRAKPQQNQWDMAWPAVYWQFAASSAKPAV
jgi:hypothetical protein